MSLNNIFRVFMIAASTFLSGSLFAQDEALNVLGKWLKYEDSKSSLYNHYADQAFQFLDAREAEIAKLMTPESWLERQKRILRRSSCYQNRISKKYTQVG